MYVRKHNTGLYILSPRSQQALIEVNRLIRYLFSENRQKTTKSKKAIFDENFIYCILNRVKTAGSIDFFEYVTGS
jgi:hypothetical protein